MSAADSLVITGFALAIFKTADWIDIARGHATPSRFERWLFRLSLRFSPGPLEIAMPDSAPASGETTGTDGLTPTERLDFLNRFRDGIGSRPSAAADPRSDGAASDHTAPAERLTQVFRLVGPGRPSWHHHGTFSSIDAAKAAAEWHLAIYREAEPSDDVEPVRPEVAWTMEQVLVARNHRVGEPIPHLVFGEDGSAFRIETVELDVTTYPDGREFRP